MLVFTMHDRQTPTIFTLATRLTDMQVDTSVDEADVGSVRAVTFFLQFVVSMYVRRN